MAIAITKPTPIIFTNTMPEVANAPTTTTSSRAALVMMPPVRCRPSATARVLSPVRSYSSLIRLSRAGGNEQQHERHQHDEPGHPRCTLPEHLQQVHECGRLAADLHAGAGGWRNRSDALDHIPRRKFLRGVVGVDDHRGHTPPL
jgi:hypothetical protein